MKFIKLKHIYKVNGAIGEGRRFSFNHEQALHVDGHIRYYFVVIELLYVGCGGGTRG